MRRFAWLAIAFALLGPLAPARAQMQTQGITVGSPPPQSLPRSSGALRKLAGTVAAIDALHRSFVCQWKGRGWTFATTPGTSFRLRGAAVNFVDLRLGDRVAVYYRTAGRRLIARRVAIAR